MNENNKIWLFFIVGFIASMLFGSLLGFLNVHLLMSNRIAQTQLQKLEEMSQEEINDLKSNAQYDEETNSFIADSETISVISWPWYSLILFIIIYSVYWYSFGRVYKKLFPSRGWKLSLVVPGIMGIIFMDIFMPVYLICCYAGASGRLTFKNDRKLH